MACPIIGAGLGVSFVIELHGLFPAAALTLALYSIPARTLPRAAMRGFGMGFACCGVAGHWLPDAFQSMGSTPLESWLLWSLVCCWTGGVRYAGIGCILQGIHKKSIRVGGTAVGVTIFFAEHLVSTSDWGIPGILLGYPMRGHPGIAQFAVVAGVPGLSSLIGTSAYLASRLRLRQRDLRRVSALTAAWCALATFGLPLSQYLRPLPSPASADQQSMLFIQPDFEMAAKWDPAKQTDNLERISSYTAIQIRSAEERLDAVFWPETTLTSRIDLDPTLRTQLEDWVHRWNTPLIAGLVTGAPNGEPNVYRNSTLWIDPTKGVIAETHKTRTVPLFESNRRLPYQAWLEGLMGSASQWQKVEAAAESGPLRGSFEVGVLACYESLFPDLAAARRDSSTILLVNLSDDTWIAGETATRQLTRFSSYRAIEQRIPFVRLAHGGLSAAYDPFGQETEAAPMNRFAAFRITATPSPTPLAYERLSLLLLFFIPGCIVWYAWPWAFRNRKGCREKGLIAAQS